MTKIISNDSFYVIDGRQVTARSLTKMSILTHQSNFTNENVIEFIYKFTLHRSERVFNFIELFTRIKLFYKLVDFQW